MRTRPAFFLGATIHDVAQVVGAGYSISAEVGDAAVLTKLLRVAMLLPIVTAISLASGSAAGSRPRRRDPLLPTVSAGLRRVRRRGKPRPDPEAGRRALNEIARACLVVAIAAVGLKTSPREMKKSARAPSRSSRRDPVPRGAGADGQSIAR